jgi:hypothetical protein
MATGLPASRFDIAEGCRAGPLVGACAGSPIGTGIGGFRAGVSVSG